MIIILIRLTVTLFMLAAGGVAGLSAQMAAEAPDASAPALRSPDGLRYAVENGVIVGRNGPFYNNRPLYCPHGPAAVLGGDRPLIRFLEDQHVYGTFSAGLLRGAGGKWLQNAAAATVFYRCGRLKWLIADPLLPGVEATLEAVPLAGAVGFAARLRVNGVRAGDRVVWAFGGAHAQKNAMWALDPMLLDQNLAWSGQVSKVLSRGVEPDRCRNNRVVLSGGTFRLDPPGGGRTVAGRASAGALRVADASAFADPADFAASEAGELPMAAGVVAVEGGAAEIFFAVEALRDASVSSTSRLADPREAFLAAIAYMEQIERRVVVQTPDPYLDAALSAANHALDAVYYPPVFRHGCMAWNVPFPGWRTMFGPTTFGWHDRVLEQARYYIASQIKESANRTADPDPEVRLTHESKKSRFWGTGRITRDAGMYNFQSQFFDQLIHSWRWTGDAKLEQLLRESLALHAGWVRDCFDPDGDGLYESYINVWPTDTVWYNGGGSVEESSYAYTVQRALADMARRAGDAGASGRHSRQAARIRQALRDVLWIEDKGHFGAYQEQGGRRRVHEDAWLYSQFLPVDAKLTTFEQALQALHYSEWGLENVRPRFGGRRVWTSNWVPSKWSVRELYLGDNYHLALAYFQSGLGEEGYEIVKGNVLDSAFAKVVPGAQAQPEGGSDFNDMLSMFGRVVVEGLFGFEPDYPNGEVNIRPAFPASWPAASIATPDYTLSYRQTGSSDRYIVTLTRPAALRFRLPARATAVTRVTLNGAPVEWSAEPGAGCAMLRIGTAETTRAEVVVELAARLTPAPAQSIAGKPGDPVRLKIAGGTLIAVNDLHGVLANRASSPGEITATLAAKPGHHLVLAKVRTGRLDHFQVFRLHISDADAEAARAARTPRRAPKDARWECLDLTPRFNGDIRTIYRQKYLSPRPKTASVRIGVDGYSAWTFPYWKLDPPSIGLGNIPKLTDSRGRIVTPQDVPFSSFREARNIAFTSLWDNWPDAVTVPVGRQADTVWVLVGGTTNPMQTRTANAELRFRYADGQVEKLELIPPLNFWTLCPLGDRDYSYERDAFALPPEPPPTVQLGENCRAMVLAWKLRPGVRLEDITLESLSQEVVIGLMGVSLMNPR